MIDRDKVCTELEESLDIINKVEEPSFWLDYVHNAIHHALQILGQPARLLSYEEIEALPELAVVWEEVRVVWEEAVKNYPGLMPEDDAVDVSIAPVEKQGRKLCGSGMNTDIRPDMLDEDRGTQVRYWSARPSDAQREAASWE